MKRTLKAELRDFANCTRRMPKYTIAKVLINTSKITNSDDLPSTIALYLKKNENRIMILNYKLQTIGVMKFDFKGKLTEIIGKLLETTEREILVEKIIPENFIEYYTAEEAVSIIGGGYSVYEFLKFHK